MIYHQSQQWFCFAMDFSRGLRENSTSSGGGLKVSRVQVLKCEHFIKVPEKKTTRFYCQESFGEIELLKAKDNCVWLSQDLYCQSCMHASLLWIFFLWSLREKNTVLSTLTKCLLLLGSWDKLQLTLQGPK